MSRAFTADMILSGSKYLINPWSRINQTKAVKKNKIKKTSFLRSADWQTAVDTLQNYNASISGATYMFSLCKSKNQRFPSSFWDQD